MLAQFECSTCGKSFTSKTNCKRHEIQKHGELGEHDKFGCPECGRQFIRKHDLSRHIVARHTDLSKEKHVCQVCSRTFARQSLLQTHMEVHEDNDGSQKFICHHCCVPFKSKKFLERHISIHARKKKGKICGNDSDVAERSQFLEYDGKVSKKSCKERRYLEIVEEAVSLISGGSSSNGEDVEIDAEAEKDESPKDGTKLRGKRGVANTNTNYQCDGMPTFPTGNSLSMEELSPDQFVMDYVSNKMKETQQESHRQQFLLSLLPDVQEMSSTQFRSFRQQVCSIIDMILKPDLSTQESRKQ